MLSVLSFIRSLVVGSAALLATGCVGGGTAADAVRNFGEALATPAVLVFAEPGGDDVGTRWILDGLEGKVRGVPGGFELHAGREVGNDAHHVVLWTQQSFEGDVRIEYEYTRLDQETRNVNIIYLFASGSGEGRFAKDIQAWRGLRTEPSMRWYFDNAHLYHISYAAFDNFNTDPAADYVRARRYRPDLGLGLKGTELVPDFERTGLFAPGVPHRITVIRCGADLYFHVRNSDVERTFHWNTTNQPPIDHGGPIGLRHMFGRSARYLDFRVLQLAPLAPR